MGRAVFKGRSPPCPPLPGKAIKLYFSTSPRTPCPRFNLAPVQTGWMFGVKRRCASTFSICIMIRASRSLCSVCHSQPVVTLPRLENYCPSGATQAFFRLWRRTEKPLCSSSSPTLLLCHPQWEGNKADTEKSWEDRGMVSYICTVLTKEDLGLISSSATHLLDDVGESSSLNLFHHFLMKEGGREGKGRRWEDRREKQGDGGGEKRRNMNSL